MHQRIKERRQSALKRLIIQAQAERISDNKTEQVRIQGEIDTLKSKLAGTYKKSIFTSVQGKTNIDKENELYYVIDVYQLKKGGYRKRSERRKLKRARKGKGGGATAKSRKWVKDFVKSLSWRKDLTGKLRSGQAEYDPKKHIFKIRDTRKSN